MKGFISRNKFNIVDNMDKRMLFNLLGLTVMVMTFTICKSQSASVPSTPEEALAELIAGNERYVNEECVNPRSDMERVEETAPHQAPFAAVVGCSDSRVPVELLFDDAIHHHAHVQVERIVAYPHVAEKIESEELLVKQAYYNVNTGKVTIY